MNRAGAHAVPEWPEEWSSRPFMMADEQVPNAMQAYSYGLVYGGPSEPTTFEEWEKDPTNALSMELLPTFTDVFGIKKVYPEPQVSEPQLSSWPGVVLPSTHSHTSFAHASPTSQPITQFSKQHEALSECPTSIPDALHASPPKPTDSFAAPNIESLHHQQQMVMTPTDDAPHDGSASTIRFPTVESPSSVASNSAQASTGHADDSTTFITAMQEELLELIGSLDLPSRQKIAQLVDQLQPSAVIKNACEWSFSINHLSDSTVAHLTHLISTTRSVPLMDLSPATPSSDFLHNHSHLNSDTMSTESSQNHMITGTDNSAIWNPAFSTNILPPNSQLLLHHPLQQQLQGNLPYHQMHLAHTPSMEMMSSPRSVSSPTMTPMRWESEDSAMSSPRVSGMNEVQEEVRAGGSAADGFKRGSETDTYESMAAYLPKAKRTKITDDLDEQSTSEESTSDYTASSGSGDDGSGNMLNSDDPLTCPVCQRNFASAAAVNKHMRLHHEERSFSCTHPGCTKRFSHSSTLKDHMNIHLQRKPYTCKECGKGFPNGSNLNRHARIHTKSKPYVCPVCNKAFSQSSNLRVHQKIHERPSKND